MEIQVELVRILINEGGQAQVIVVKECEGERLFPISIGFFEAAAIDRRLKEMPIPRPMTHELVENVISGLGGRLVRVVISDLVGHTFIGKLVVEHQGRELEIDCRPSDAIALAVGDSVPIFCEERVLDSAALPPGEMM
ncbi:MAG: bifunctional nuclease family protein [Anaerolineaceae bacterium]|nr:bifunctional nuclease family protein [Anaerolineaceae bacterium]